MISLFSLSPGGELCFTRKVIIRRVHLYSHAPGSDKKIGPEFPK